MDTPPHSPKYPSLYNHSNHSPRSLPNIREDDQITREIQEAIMDDYAISPLDTISETGRLIPGGQGPFHGDIKDLCDIDDECKGQKMHLFMIAFSLLLFIACAGNFFIGVYATLHDWSTSVVVLHLAFGNLVFVCGIMWLRKRFSI